MRVLVADDHRLFRELLIGTLAARDGIEVVGEASNHSEAVEVASKAKPDVVLLDLQMPGILQADQSIRRMLQLTKPPHIIIVTMHDEPRLRRRYLGLGASAYLVKTASLKELVDAVEEAASSPRTQDEEEGIRGMPAEEREDFEKVDDLSAREVEVLLQVARGMSNRQAAASLFLSEGTVKRHMANIYKKLGVGARSEATKVALANGWISAFEIIEN